MIMQIVGRGGGQVVSMLAFYSDDPSSNSADGYSFLKRTKINKKEARVGSFKKNNATRCCIFEILNVL